LEEKFVLQTPTPQNVVKVSQQVRFLLPLPHSTHCALQPHQSSNNNNNHGRACSCRHKWVESCRLLLLLPLSRPQLKWEPLSIMSTIWGNYVVGGSLHTIEIFEVL